jgi:hypothetical protein
MRRLVLLLVVGAALALSGCASRYTDREGIPAPTMGDAPRVQVIRSGGIAGVHDVLSVDPNGRWTFSNRQSSNSTGMLDEATRGRLTDLVSSAHLPSAAAQATPDPACADQFQYELHVDTAVYNFDDCHGVQAPLSDVLDLLQRATPL